ncbi:hypothetical protein GCM10010109_77390 [Actinoplanes campanulatus]|nr:hypothetical protein GCM10010109_77390 [Actinoplanes campanulatus]GID37351.1 hypothetical protein Aca09nite_38570 [Actinoplanes campanulatus]
MPSPDPTRPPRRAPEAPTRPRRHGILTAWKDAHPEPRVCAHRGYRSGAGTHDADREARAALE